MTVLIRVLAGLAATIALPSLAFAQAGGGVCLFTGKLTFDPPIGLVPSVCQSPAGCQKVAFSGSLGGPTCSGFDGTLTSRLAFVVGAHGCEGNVHGAVLDHSRFPGRPFSVYGVCAGGVCSGGGYATFGAIRYELIVDAGSAGTVASQCAAGNLRNLPLVGVAAGAATN